MRVHLILLLVTACLVTSHASPQRNANRQGERDSVLSMGMKFLGNMRERVTGLFRPRGRPAKARPQRPPPPQPHQQPQFENQVPDHVIPGQTNSNFAVVHESDVVTRAAPQTLPLQDDNNSFQPSSFFNSNRPFQGNFEQESFSAPKRPNDFGFGNPKDESKFTSSFSREINSRPSNQNHHSSGFQQSHGVGSFSPPSFSNNGPVGFPQFRHSSSASSPSSSSPSSSPSSSSPSSAFASSFSSSSSFNPSTGSVATKPQTHQPLQDNHIPEIFTVADPQRHESNTPKQKFRTNITPSKPTFTHRLAPTSFSTTTRRIAPTRPSTHSPPFVVRPTRASVPSHPKKPVFPAKPSTGSRHVNVGFKQQVTPKDGNKASRVAGYEWGYGVLDSDTGNQFFHAEKREEGTTKGSYKIQLPDGRIQTVTYTADDKGFHPEITYEGEAKFPDSSDNTNDKSDS